MNTIRKINLSLIPLLGLSVHAMEERPNLHQAARIGDNKAIQRAIKATPLNELKKEVNSLDERGYTPLGYALRYDHTEVAKTLLKEKDLIDLQVKSNGEAPLFMAARLGRTDALILLLRDKEAKVKETDDTGKTLLHETAKGGHLKSVELLIGDKAPVNAKDNNLMTPLHYAAQQGKASVVEYLISKKAEVNAKNDKGDTPLILASRWGNGNSKEVVEILLKSGKIDNINQVNNTEETALHAAARSSRPKTEVIKILLKAKADPTFKDTSGQTPAEATTHKSIQKLLTI